MKPARQLHWPVLVLQFGLAAPMGSHPHGSSQATPYRPGTQVEHVRPMKLGPHTHVVALVQNAVPAGLHVAAHEAHTAFIVALHRRMG